MVTHNGPRLCAEVGIRDRQPNPYSTAPLKNQTLALILPPTIVQNRRCAPLLGVDTLIYSLFWRKAILSMADWRSRLACQFIFFFQFVPGRAKHRYFALFFCPVLEENHSPKSWVCQFSRLTSKSRRLNFESKLSLPQSPTFRSQSRISPVFRPVSLS